MQYTDEELLEYDPFQGEEGELSLESKKIVKARKEHNCFFKLGTPKQHSIKVGERHIHHKALVDGDYFGSYRYCLNCLVKEMDDCYGDEE